MRCVEVEWLDSMTLNYGKWAYREEHEEAFEHMTHRSCGYLFSENEKGIILALTTYEAKAGDRAKAAMLIPHGAIVSIRTLRAEEE